MAHPPPGRCFPSPARTPSTLCPLLARLRHTAPHAAPASSLSNSSVIGPSASRPKRGYKKLQLLLETDEERFVDYLPQATAEVGPGAAAAARGDQQSQFWSSRSRGGDAARCQRSARCRHAARKGAMLTTDPHPNAGLFRTL